MLFVLLIYPSTILESVTESKTIYSSGKRDQSPERLYVNTEETNPKHDSQKFLLLLFIIFII